MTFVYGSAVPQPPAASMTPHGSTSASPNLHAKAAVPASSSRMDTDSDQDMTGMHTKICIGNHMLLSIKVQYWIIAINSKCY